jgi:esterase/lipase superfamily enzyme
MASMRRTKARSLTRAKVGQELLRFFRARLLKPGRIDVNSNVKELCGYARAPARWRVLARNINSLPGFKENGLRISPAAMAATSTIAEIIVELFEASGVSKVPIKKGVGKRGHGVARRAKQRIAKPARKKRRKKKGGGGGWRGLVVSRAKPRTTKRRKEISSGGRDIAFSGVPTSPKVMVDTSLNPLYVESPLEREPFGTDRREPQDDARYAVWYGTNRALRDAGDPSKGYSANRDTKVHLGICDVFIPKSHKIGSIGSSWWERVKTGVDDRLKILNIAELAADAFWGKLAAHLGHFPVEERDAVIFVHGYNVAFEEAALRAAQIGFDLSVKGGMAFFSWPSQGALSKYASDEASIEASELAIMQFMIDFAMRSGAPRVHIIAHSMGNRGVLRAVDRIATRAQEITGVKFGQIILAAADVDADTFRNLCAAYVRVSQRTTLYVSTRDLAVEASQWLHTFPRAGLLPPIMIVPGIDTINVTNADLTALGHGYVAEARGVLQDMHQLLVHGDAPERRFGLEQGRTAAGERYWLIRR